MLGDECFKLAKEAKDVTPDHIPAYNEELVRLVTQESRYLWRRVVELIQATESSSQQSSSGVFSPSQSTSKPDLSSQPFSNDPADVSRSMESENMQGQVALYVHTIERNKRCLMAYHRKRAEFLQSLLWAVHLAPTMVPQNVSQRLAPEEQNYAREYAKLNMKYRDSVEATLCPNDSLDWALNGEVPPRDLLIEVRVHRDCGEIVTQSGIVNLQAGTQHYLCRSDVEHLLTIGYLEHINPT
ncbi:GINS complex, Psf1 component [Linderina pennispora]|uniref:DNA replication complex GINS protein PSF1 n=1 Tax=Linderina pennispora TaxID=61395 RepID=A0A1Y1VZ86_9FUNG|nr:GINS complex, Psf1 component [Linderina pennispora]ORX66571.1 GINS complex, Psf1 component [Linderina pennispora]